jgi:hypothetical protein
MERLPPPEAFTKEELDGGATPWADSPEGSDRLVSLSIRCGADDADLDTIVELARKYELVLYDPQGPSLHSPGGKDETPYSPSPGELSIPVLTWVLVFVGGFVALVAAFSLVAIAQRAWQARGN